MSLARAGIRLLLAAMALCLCLPLHLLTPAFARGSRWPRRFLALVARICGLRIATIGTPRAAQVLFVANHRSWLDILVLAGATGYAFVSKAEVARWPVVGFLARLHGTIFVERGRRGDAPAQAAAVRAALAAGRAVALFPEGTTNPGPGLLPFRPSLLAAAAPAPAGVVVQPVLIDYGAAEPLVGWPDGEGAAANIRRILGHRGTIAVTLRFLAPLAPAADRKALAAAARAALLEQAGGLR